MKLSKSLYTRGLQCVKSLWLKKYRKDLLTPPDESIQAIFETGNRVGELACELFPNGVKVPFDSTNYEGMIEKTKILMDSNITNIYEASFSYDNIFVAIDILHINEDKSVEIYEVKSSTEVKDIYLHDASIQYYVLNEIGFNVKKVSIVHLNNKYVRGDELEIDKLFTVADVTDEVKEPQGEIPENIERFRRVLRDQINEPKIDIGKHCSDPYECDAMEYCWRHIPEYSIFNISRLNSDKKFELYRQGVVNFEDIPDISAFSPAQQIQIRSELTKEEIIDNEAIREFIDSLSYPLYHLDFETFQQAIPEYKGISPFMQIPFQYSLHIEQKDGKLDHKEFLAEDGVDPRYELAKHLINDIPTDVTVLAYNMGFEKGVIKRLAEEFDEFRDHLLCIHDNIQDLMTPFQKRYYYTPKMRGSYSIKYVLPALVPEMAEAYKKLDGVQNGGDAMRTFAQLSEIEDEKEKARLREALLRYCELDTLAMVKILEKLREVANETRFVYVCSNCEAEHVYFEKINVVKCENCGCNIK